MICAQSYYVQSDSDEMKALKAHALSKINLFRLIQAETEDKGGSPDPAIADLVAYNQAVVEAIDIALLEV